jgi:hypothetical protein
VPIVVVTSEGIQVGMAAQSLGGTNVSVANIEISGDGTMSDAVRGDDFIDPGGLAQRAHQSINGATIESMSFATPI